MTENRVALMRALFADLAERVDAAYEPFAGQQPEAKFDSWLDQRTTEVLPSAARLSIDDAAAAEHFELAFSSAREVAQAELVRMNEDMGSERAQMQRVLLEIDLAQGPVGRG